MGKCVLFLFFYASSNFLLRTEKPGIEGDWEQIDARDIGENNRGLSDRTLLIYFMRVEFSFAERKSGTGG